MEINPSQFHDLDLVLRYWQGNWTPVRSTVIGFRWASAFGEWSSLLIWLMC